MAAVAVPTSDATLEKNLTCSICMDIFSNPVTTPCGHSFCRTCLELSISPYRVNDMCPLCKKHLNKSPDTELENTKKDLEDRIEIRKMKMNEINKALRDSLKPLESRREVMETEAKDLNDKLEEEINKIEKTISELDDISSLEDHILFLQRYPSLSDQDNITDWTDVELDTTLSFGSMRETTTTMKLPLAKTMKKMSGNMDIKLDPKTAHRRLVLSPDGKEVRDGGENQEVADSLKRFDELGSVMGLNSLTSEKAYWEVEVNNKTGWDLGVARGSANRKGKLTLSPDEGYWVLVHYEAENYAAMTAPPTRVSLKGKPDKVGVFVDYEECLVSFYDVTAKSHIYSFTECLFKDELHPYFSPHVKQEEMNSEALVISTENYFEFDEE
uniref:E3 ubiquitin-protein ligase TRIM21-like n=1 Tax=Poecilia reticulata TaxID=8081 RepID=A0A3P9Q9D3_POERE